MDRHNLVKKAPLILLGEKLKIAREARSLDIDQVQKQTHINSRVLIALEDGRCDEILTPTYVKGFIKKYALFLGLDARDILKEYSSLHDDEDDSQLKFAPDGGFYPTLRRFAFILFFVLLLALFLFAAIWIGSAVKRSVTSGKKTRPPAAALRKPEVPAAKRGPFTLTLKIKKSVFIKAAKDGFPIFSRVFTKGITESIKADKKVKLYIADSESVELIVNDKSIGFPGRGVAENLEVTSLGITKK